MSPGCGTVLWARYRLLISLADRTSRIFRPLPCGVRKVRGDDAAARETLALPRRLVEDDQHAQLVVSAETVPGPGWNPERLGSDSGVGFQGP